MRARRWRAMFPLAALGLVLAAPAAAADPAGTQVVGSVTLTPTVDAWFSRGACAAGAPCSGPPMVSPAPVYPAHSMHVALTGGSEADRSYLVFALGAVPHSATITGGTLTVPLDANPSDGALDEQAAHVTVCAVTTPVASAEGSTATPPGTDCTLSATAAYSGVPTPRLVADLGALAPVLPTAQGLALLPVATAARDTWQVVYAGHAEKAAPAKPAQALISYSETVSVGAQPTPGSPGPLGAGQPPLATPAARQEPLAPSTATQATPSVGAGSTGVSPTGAAPVDAGSAVSRGSTSSPGRVPTASSVGGALGSSPGIGYVTVGYAYPVVWLLPLLVLVVGAVLARQLTEDLTPPRPIR